MLFKFFVFTKISQRNNSNQKPIIKNPVVGLLVFTPQKEPPKSPHGSEPWPNFPSGLGPVVWLTASHQPKRNALVSVLTKPNRLGVKLFSSKHYFVTLQISSLKNVFSLLYVCILKWVCCCKLLVFKCHIYEKGLDLHARSS